MTCWRRFTHPGGRQAVETASNKSAMMTSPSGFAFDLCQHIKEGMIDEIISAYIEYIPGV
jgi:hypothetical protein